MWGDLIRHGGETPSVCFGSQLPREGAFDEGLFCSHGIAKDPERALVPGLDLLL